MEIKVSLVVTCYNKFHTVSNMLTSILNQKWNRIEVVLVDDGSTDGTSDVLTSWKPKLEKRGYEVIIIRQENAGVSSAAKTGMENISGEFMCLIDCDDELDPLYVSTMADWLAKNSEYDFCMCTHKRKLSVNGQVMLSDIITYAKDGKIESYDSQQRTFYYILHEINPVVWVHMVRTAYLHRCNIPKLFHTEIRTTQESNFVTPLMAGTGKVKYFPDPLYIHDYTGEGAAYRRNYTSEKWDYIALKEKNWYELLKITVQALNIDLEFKKKALFLADFRHFYIMYYNAYNLNPSAGFYYIKSAILLINQYYSTSLDANIYKDNFFFIKDIVMSIIFNLPAPSIPKFSGKVIAYGVLGQRGKRFLHLLNNTSYVPAQLWDMNGDNVVVQKPDFSLLKREDLLIIFPNDLKLDVICHQISFTDLYLNILNQAIFSTKI